MLVARREFLLTLQAAAPSAQPLVVLPIHRATDVRCQSTEADFQRFWSQVWPEAVRDFSRCGVRFAETEGGVEIRQSPAGRPVLVGLRPHAVNMVLTANIPLYWDNARGLAGLTGVYENRHVSMIALSRAHPHRVPLIGVNTVVHELLHLLLGDAFVSRPGRFEMQRREWNNDWVATRMWLGVAGSVVRAAAQSYLGRLLNLP